MSLKMASQFSSSTSSEKASRYSIRSSLAPANVQDLKAKFDSGKSDTSSTVSSVQVNKAKTSEENYVARLSSVRDVSLTSSVPKNATSTTLSSVSSSLQAAAQRKIGTSSIGNESNLASKNSILKTNTSNLLSSSKSSTKDINPSLLPSKPGLASSSSLNNPVVESTCKVSSSTTSIKLTQPASVSSFDRNSPKKDITCKVSSSSTISNKSTRPASVSSSGSLSPNKDITKLSSSSTTSIKSTRPSSVSSSDRNSPSKDITKISTSTISNKSIRPASEFSTVSLRCTASITPSSLGTKSNFDKNINGSALQKSTCSLETNINQRPRSSTLDSKFYGIGNDKKDVGSSYLNNKSSIKKSELDLAPSSVTKSTSQTEKSLSKESSSIQKSNTSSTKDLMTKQIDTAAVSVSTATKSSSSDTVNINVVTKTVEYTTTESKPSALSTSVLALTSDKNVVQQPEFMQVKLRKTGTSENASKQPFARENLKVASSNVEEKRVFCKINSDRFEKLMSDFKRGVPSEVIVRRPSETDHIIVQQKASELSKAVPEDDVPIISKKRKESSIFTEGLKVSDFVKQVNKLNPEKKDVSKLKVQKAQSDISSVVSSEIFGDNFYQGIPGEDWECIDDDGDGNIYEKVTNRAQSTTDDDFDEEGPKSPDRKLGVYKQMKNITNNAFKILKQRGSKKKGKKKSADKSKNITGIVDKEISSDGSVSKNGDGSSSGTECDDTSPSENDHPVEAELCLYEDLEKFAKPTSEALTNKTITNKLRNIFNKKSSKKNKNKLFIDQGVSGGTESEADTVDDADHTDSDTTKGFSRTGSKRSSFRSKQDISAPMSIHSSVSATTIQPNTEDLTSSLCEQQISGLSSALHSPPPLPPRVIKGLNQPIENPPLPPRNEKHNPNPSVSDKSKLINSQESAMPVSPTNKIANCTSNNQKAGKTLQPNISKSTIAVSSITYPDINAFPELKGDDVSLYVDLEDVQIYGKASDFYVSKFESEPLYQWYSKNKVIQNLSSNESTSNDLSSDDDDDDDEYKEETRRPESVYEDVEKLLERSSTTNHKITSSKSIECKGSANVDQTNAEIRPGRRTVIEEVFKRGSSLHRALWCQMPEVIESGILSKLTDHEKNIQEAMFEIITSEASYLKSLKVLISVFLMAPEFSSETLNHCVISRSDRQILFSNIGNIKDISEEFLKDLEARWQESCYIKDVCDIICKYASNKFEPYIRYCSNQAYQDRAINALRLNSHFNEVVKRLEQNPDCQFLPLPSFLLLPMQRITRLPLLVDAVCHRLEPGSPAHESAKKALDSLTKVAKQCDEAAKKMQQTEQICILKSNLEFKIKEFPLISASRFLVKQGELTQIKADGMNRKTLNKLLGSNKHQVYLFLFNDILLVTKRKGSSFLVKDYCQRNTLHVESIDNTDKMQLITPSTTTGVPYILLLAMLANYKNRQVEMVLSCNSESERTRWIDAIVPKHTLSEAEKIYDCWDCPQFQCVKKYIAQEPDELNLEESDVINVARKMADGWCEGERIRDGEKGWFPSSHTEEIKNSHVRARNLRLRYRLMRASEEYAQMELHKK